MMNVMLTVAAFFWVSLPLLGGEHHYRIKSYPISADGCGQTAIHLAERLATVSGVADIRGYCEDITTYGFDLDLVYDAEQELSVISTAADQVAALNAGAYLSGEECQADVDEERARFHRATGIQSFLAYCYHDRYLRERSWILRIDGIGESAVTPFISRSLIFGRPLGYTSESFSDEIRTALARQGVSEVSFVKLESDHGYLNLVTQYYRHGKLPLKTVEFSKSLSAERCANQMLTVKQALASLTSQPLLTFCARTFLADYEVTSILTDSDLRLKDAIENFSTFESCEIDRVRLIEEYRQSMGLAILGGVCSRTIADYERQYKLVLIVDRT